MLSYRYDDGWQIYKKGFRKGVGQLKLREADFASDENAAGGHWAIIKFYLIGGLRLVDLYWLVRTKAI
jgi:hypothetical protein